MTESVSFVVKIRLAVFLVFWYGSSVQNGISSKHLLNVASVGSSTAAVILQGVVTLSSLQLLFTGVGGVGVPYVKEVVQALGSHRTLPQQPGLFQVLWKCSKSAQWRQMMFFIGFLNFLGVCSTNLSFCLGSVSMTHLIKASEPVITSIYSYIISSEPVASSRRLTGILLITVGVSFASYNNNKIGEMYGIVAALMSSLLFPLRNVLIKKMSSKQVKEDAALSGIQLFYVISMVSSIVGTMVIVSLNATPSIRLPWINHVETVFTSSMRNVAYFDTVMATVTFLLYNTFSMIVLQQCSVSTHAIFNILKRGVVILISAALFDDNFDHHLLGGTGLVLLGLWLYKK